MIPCPEARRLLATAREGWCNAGLIPPQARRHALGRPTRLCRTPNEPRGTNEPSGADGSAGPTDPRRERTRERRPPNEPSRARPKGPGDAAAQRNRRSEKPNDLGFRNPNEPSGVRIRTNPRRSPASPGWRRCRREPAADVLGRGTRGSAPRRSTMPPRANGTKVSGRRQMREIVVSGTPEKKFCKRRKIWRCGIARSCKQSGRWQYLRSQPQ